MERENNYELLLYTITSCTLHERAASIVDKSPGEDTDTRSIVFCDGTRAHIISIYYTTTTVRTNNV